MPVDETTVQFPNSGRLFRSLRHRVLRLISPPLKHWYWRRYAAKRLWRWRDLEIEVWPSVFAPGLTGSTAFTLDYIRHQELDGLVVAEVGCGTGVLGILAALRGGRVHAADINPRAVANCRANAARNGVSMEVGEGSFLEPFTSLAPDLILVSPPYYPKDPSDLAEAAWYCGEGHSYFQQFFAQLALPAFSKARTLMNLSEDCDLETILAIARQHRLAANLAHAKRIWGEWFYILEFRQA